MGPLAAAAVPDEITMKNHMEMAGEAVFKLNTALHVSDLNKLVGHKKLPKEAVVVMKAVKALLVRIIITF